jgi:hypothetical protein
MDLLKSAPSDPDLKRSKPPSGRPPPSPKTHIETQSHGRILWSRCSDAGRRCSMNRRTALSLAAIWRVGALYKIIIDCSRNVIGFLINRQPSNHQYNSRASLRLVRRVFPWRRGTNCRSPTYKQRHIGGTGCLTRNSNALRTGIASIAHKIVGALGVRLRVRSPRLRL